MSVCFLFFAMAHNSMYKLSLIVFIAMHIAQAYVNWTGSPSALANLAELQCLRDLPVDHLLKIRRALQLLTSEQEASGATISEHRIGFPAIGRPPDIPIIDDGRLNNRSEIMAMPLIGHSLK